MKLSKGGFAIFAAFLLVFLISTNAESTWLMEDEEEVISLRRIDTEDLDAPEHEIDQGVYGFYDENEVWILVVDFNCSEPIQSPYTWYDVQWVEGYSGPPES